MTKEEHIVFWKENADDDWQSANILFVGKQFTFCLFTCHLVIEKLLKAAWIKENSSDFPPRTHNLLMLFNQTNLDLTDEQQEYLREINNWQIEGRYPDYNRTFHRIANESYTNSNILKIKELRKCLLKELP